MLSGDLSKHDCCDVIANVLLHLAAMMSESEARENSQEEVMETGDGADDVDDVDDDDDQGGEEAELQELMQNKEFLQSVLGSLPGVNPEEAMQNLQELTGEKDAKKDDEDKVLFCGLCVHFHDVYFLFRRTQVENIHNNNYYQ